MKAIRLQRFRAFEDTGWIELKPITLLFGYNSSGKSTILRAIQMLKQSIDNSAIDVPFVLSSKKGVDLGSFQDLVHQNIIDHDNPIIISIKINYSTAIIEGLRNKDIIGAIKNSNDEDTCDYIYEMKISYNQKRRTIVIIGFSIYSEYGENIISMERANISENSSLKLKSDFYDNLSDIELEWENFIPQFHRKVEFTMLLGVLLTDLKESLERTVSVGPIRSIPDRTMLFSGEKPGSVGYFGEDTFKLLYTDRYSAQSKKLDEKINIWLADYNYKYEWIMLKSNLGQMILKELDSKENFSANIVDVGFGISQILPIAVQLLSLEKDSYFLMEQPEIHLHSKAQADFADLLIKSSEINDSTSIIETHSENILLRICRRVAEKEIAEDKIGLYYISRRNGVSNVDAMSINSFGDIIGSSEEFKEFFSTSFEDIIKIQESHINSFSKSEKK